MIAVGLVFAVAALIFLAPGPVGASAAETDATSISSCGTQISSSGTYELDTSIGTSLAATCLDVSADDVILDGGGYRIDLQNESALGVNVTAADPSNITLRNVTVDGGAIGVLVNQSASAEIRNVTLQNVTVTDADVGVLLENDKSSATLENISIHDSRFETDGVPVDLRESGGHGTVDLAVTGTAFNVTSGTALSIDVENTTGRFNDFTDVTFTFRNNEVTATGGTSSSRIIDLWDFDRSQATTALDIRDNRFELTDENGGYLLYLGSSGDNADIDVSIVNNTYDATDGVEFGDGIEINHLSPGGEAVVEIRENTLLGSANPDDHTLRISGQNTPATVDIADNHFRNNTLHVTVPEDNQRLNATVQSNTFEDGSFSLEADGDDAPANVSVTNNTIATNGIVVETQRSNATTDVAITRNELVGERADIATKPYGDNGTSFVTITNNTVDGGGAGTSNGLTVSDAPNPANVTLDAEVRDNVLNGTGGLSVFATAAGGNMAVDLTDNRIGNDSSTAALALSFAAVEQTIDLDVRRNAITDPQGTKTRVDIDLDAANLTADATLADNRFELRQFGIRTIAHDANSTYDVSLRNNTINLTAPDIDRNGFWFWGHNQGSGQNSTLNFTATNNTFTNVYLGVDLDLGLGPGVEGSPHRLEIRDNEIRATEQGIDINSPATDRNHSVSVRDNNVTSGGEALSLETASDGGTNDVDVNDNRFDTGSGAVMITSEGYDMDLSYTATGNIIDAGAGGMYLTLRPTGFGTNRRGDRDVHISDNDITSRGSYDGGVALDATRENLTLNATMTDNTLDSNRGVILDANADNQSVETEIAGNDVDVENGGIYLSASGDDTSADVTVERNSIVDNASGGDGDSGISIRLSGEDQSVGARIASNDVDDAIVGLEIDSVQHQNASTFEFNVTDNEITNALAEGVEIVQDAGNGATEGTLLIERNYIQSDSTTVQIEDGPVAGIVLTENHFDGNGFGVENLNTTAGAVEATNNYWNESDGPGSAGPLADPETGTLADGGGSNVTERGGGVSNVRFDPWLSSPPQIGLDPVGPFQNPPTDQNGDGLYRDVNGDGSVDVADVQALSVHLSDSTIQDNVDKFDFAGTGDVTAADVGALYADVVNAISSVATPGRSLPPRGGAVAGGDASAVHPGGALP